MTASDDLVARARALLDGIIDARCGNCGHELFGPDEHRPLLAELADRLEAAEVEVSRLSPRRIETVEEVRACPVGTVLRCEEGTVYELVDWGEGDPPQWSTDGMPDRALMLNLGELVGALVLWSPGGGV